MTVRPVGIALLVLVMGVWPWVSAAQSATPTTGNEPGDLAAMSLTASDVPAGFFDDYGEWWVPSRAFSDVIGAPTPPGLEQVYETFYVRPEDGTTIHVFLFAFASAAEAGAGSSLVDLALRPPLPAGTVIGPEHAPGPDVGDIPSETTVVTYDTWAAGGPRVDVVADAFRQDRLLAGVSIETYTDPPSDGTPVTAGATPVAPDAAQTHLAATLAATLAERITNALAGQALADIDPTLSEIVLPLDQLVDVQTPMLGGYKSGIDLLRCGICGEANTLLPFAGDARGGFSRIVSLGPVVDGEPQAPFVLVAVADFRSPTAAKGVLDAIRQQPNDLPTSGPIPRGARTPAPDPRIPGADAALAYQAIANPDDSGAPVDGAGVDFVIGSRLVTVDVVGGLSADAAMAAAVDLATQQAACLTAGGPCVTVTRPLSIPAAP